MKLKFKNTFLPILLFFILNCIQSYVTPLVDDEAYYWVWSQHLDWGYYDHPPMIALWIKIGYLIFPNELGVRILSCVLNSLVFLFWLDILKPFTQKEFQLFWLLVFSFIFFQVFGFITTPDSCLLFFGSFYLWALYYFIKNKSTKNIVLFGISMVLAMYSKYHALLLIVFSLFPLLKSLLKEKKFYFAVLFSIVLYLPHIIWQYHNDFISLQYHFLHRNDHTMWKWLDLGNFFIGFVAFGSPLLLCFMIQSLKIKNISFFEKSLFSVILCTSVFFFIMAFRTKIQPQWYLIIFISLFPLFYNYVKKINTIKAFKSLAIISILLIISIRIIISIPYFIITTPMQKLKDFVWEAYQVSDGIPVFERYQKAAAYSFYVGENAECLSMYNHRKSQYDIWKTEDKLENNEITFFSLEKTSENYISDENDKKVFYVTLNSYTKYPDIKIKFKSLKLLELYEGNNIITDSLEIKNNVDSIFIVGASEQFMLKIVIMDKKNHPTWSFYNENPTFTLNNKETMPYIPKFNINLNEGDYQAYFCIKNKDLSAKIVSDKFSIIVRE